MKIAVCGKAEGLTAEALEHEIDHLNGILYIDHIESGEKLYKIQPGTDGDKAGDNSGEL